MLEVGVKAPDFELPDQNGKIHRLSDYTGKKVILYFYPKDNTAGCTKQACGQLGAAAALSPAGAGGRSELCGGGRHRAAAV